MVVDIFRATSAICTAFEYGVKKIIPVATIEEAMAFQREGFLVGAERNGEVVEGFDFGNSPFSYMNGKVKGQTIVLTTTNGTKAISIAREANEIIIGSFLNLKALADYLVENGKDVLILCAGWRNRFNMEDTLFSGALVRELTRHPQFNNLADSAQASMHLFNLAENDLYGFLETSSHRKRLSRLNLEKDIRYCLQQSITSVVPLHRNGELIALDKLVSVE